MPDDLTMREHLDGAVTDLTKLSYRAPTHIWNDPETFHAFNSALTRIEAALAALDRARIGTDEEGDNRFRRIPDPVRVPATRDEEKP